MAPTMAMKAMPPIEPPTAAPTTDPLSESLGAAAALFWASVVVAAAADADVARGAAEMVADVVEEAMTAEAMEEVPIDVGGGEDADVDCVGVCAFAFEVVVTAVNGANDGNAAGGEDVWLESGVVGATEDDKVDGGDGVMGGAGVATTEPVQ